MPFRGARGHVLLAWLGLFTLGATQLQARATPGAGGWEIMTGDDMCAMTQEFEGEGATQLLLGLYTNGKVAVLVTNTGWTTIESQKYEIVYVLNGAAFEGGTSTGSRVGSRKGFGTNFDAGFLKDFAAAPYLTIKSSDGTIIDDLNLAGSAAGLNELRRCVSREKALADAAAREEAKLAHIPKDPFASVSPKGPLSAELRLPLVSLFSGNDYPPSSLLNREEGKVHYRLTVGTDGRVSTCTVTQSSGFAELDAATCRILQARARFNPARNDAGLAIEGTFEKTVSWSL